MSKRGGELGALKQAEEEAAVIVNTAREGAWPARRMRTAPRRL
jgi:hypothetical protein